MNYEQRIIPASFFLHELAVALVPMKAIILILFSIAISTIGCCAQCMSKPDMIKALKGTWEFDKGTLCVFIFEYGSDSTIVGKEGTIKDMDKWYYRFVLSDKCRWPCENDRECTGWSLLERPDNDGRCHLPLICNISYQIEKVSTTSLLLIEMGEGGRSFSLTKIK